MISLISSELAEKHPSILAVLAEVFVHFPYFRTFYKICNGATYYYHVGSCFHRSWKRSFAKQEMALLYLFHYILIFVAGPGSISIDRMINRK